MLPAFHGAPRGGVGGVQGMELQVFKAWTWMAQGSDTAGRVAGVFLECQRCVFPSLGGVGRKTNRFGMVNDFHSPTVE